MKKVSHTLNDVEWNQFETTIYEDSMISVVGWVRVRDSHFHSWIGLLPFYMQMDLYLCSRCYYFSLVKPLKPSN